MSEWSDEKVQKEFRRMSREISRLKVKASRANDLRIAAETRAHDAKLRAKAAEYGLRGLLQRCMAAEKKIAELETPR